ncbi:MAG: hypothetical protein KDC49_08445, partial [Saprospiraceae bacterium]|nr:hypothetical protein [Saprospiraceae bacterium]
LEYVEKISNFCFPFYYLFAGTFRKKRKNEPAMIRFLNCLDEMISFNVENLHHPVWFEFERLIKDCFHL